MIIRFGCSNYKSIFDYQELIFTASSLKDSQADFLNHPAFPEPVLPGLALYGANASGKTNMINALAFFAGFIRNSFGKSVSDTINRPYFKLNSDAKNQPSQFDIDFIFDNQHYHYGYKINDRAVLEEWLFSYTYINRKSRTVLFHRSVAEDDAYKFSKHLKGENRVIAKLTRTNCLYLSTAAQNNHDLLGGLFKYFVTGFSFRFNTNLLSSLIAQELKASNTIGQVGGFLKYAGAGIEAIRLKVNELNEKELKIANQFVEFLQKNFEDTDSGMTVEKLNAPPENVAIELVHKDDSGKLIYFELDEESLGTRAMIALLAPVFYVLNTGGIFVVDEIESSLHVLITLQVVKLFNSKATNPKGAQLLFTTHETHIMCSDILRRDQIWFSEKSPDGATVIAPLTDYQLRAADNFQKGYLEGRFGAIPFLGDIDTLFQTEGKV